MKKRKIIIRVLVYGVLGLCALLAAGWFIPFPIEGNWIGNWCGGCGCESHHFIRFEDGKILNAPGHDFLELVGTYRKSGWGQYEMELFYDTCTRLVYSTFLLARCDFGDIPDINKPLFRDPLILGCRKVLNAPESDWAQITRGAILRVMGTADERFFVSKAKTNTLQEVETLLNDWVHHKPLQIYTASNEVPSHVIETVVANGFDYHVHSNQQWVAAEWKERPYYTHNWTKSKGDEHGASPTWNPTWTNKAFNLVIRPLTDNDKAEDPDYIFGEYASTFSNVKESLERRQRRRESVTKNLYLYAENGVLPEDVRQMLEPFGIEYRVLDEKILYRGKKK